MLAPQACDAGGSPQVLGSPLPILLGHGAAAVGWWGRERHFHRAMFSVPHFSQAPLSPPDPANICRAAGLHRSMSNLCPLWFPEEVISQQV